VICGRNGRLDFAEGDIACTASSHMVCLVAACGATAQILHTRFRCAQSRASG
jgi:hypothetical protein